MTTNNDCKGCNANYICKYKEIDNNSCPCKICIIKMMCKKACEEYSKVMLLYSMTLRG